MTEIPTIKIPTWLRVVLYLAATIALLLSSYFLDRGFTWWTEAEVKLVQAAAALVSTLATVKVTREAITTRRAAAVPGEVVERSDDTSTPTDHAGVIEGGA